MPLLLMDSEGGDDYYFWFCTHCQTLIVTQITLIKLESKTRRYEYLRENIDNVGMRGLMGESQ